MRTPEALLDTNVIVAAVVGTHEANAASLDLLLSRPPSSFAVAAHSFAESFNILTRRNAWSPFRWPADKAWAAIESVVTYTVLVGLTPGETLDVIRRYAAEGGVGPRLYDRLIGETAVRHGIRRIITWNVTHMRGLFPNMEEP